MSADIEIPMLEIAVGAGIDRGIAERLRVARQHDLLGLRSGLGLYHVDGRGRGALSADAQRRLRLGPFVDARVNNRSTSDRRDSKTNQQPAGRRLSGWRREACRLGVGNFRWTSSIHVMSPV